MHQSDLAPLSTTTEKQLSAYALAALAGVGVLTTAQVADAKIITSPSAGQTINDPSGTIYLFANQGGFGANSGPAVNLSLPFQAGTTSYQRAAGVASLSPVVGNGGYFAADLAKSTTVSANTGNFVGAGAFKIGYHSHTASGINNNGGNFHGTTGFLGFRFTDPTTGKTDYGWAQITESANQNSLTLDGAAFDTTGAAILTGQTVSTVPEPGSLALLAAGAGSLALWRRRTAGRKQAAAAPGATLVS